MHDNHDTIRMRGTVASEVMEDESGSCIEVELASIDGRCKAVLMIDAGLLALGEAVDVTIARRRMPVHRPHESPRWVRGA